MPIRTRLALLSAIGTAALLTGGGLGFASVLGGSLRDSMAATLRIQAGAVIRAVERSHADATDVGAAEDQRAAADGGGAAPVSVSPAEAAAMATAVPDLGLSQLIGPAGTPLVTIGRPATPSLLSYQQLAVARRGQWLGERLFPGAAAPDLLLAEPVPDWRGTVVVVSTSLAAVHAARNRVRLALAIAGPVAVALAGLCAWLLAGAALVPVSRMRRQAAAIADTDTDAMLAVPATRDEIANLALTLNALLLRLRSALGRQRGFVAAASHELRTPLAVLRAELELAEQPGGSESELRAALRTAAAETDRLIRLAENLLLLARVDEGKPVVALSVRDLEPMARASAGAFAATANQRGVTIDVDVVPGLRAALDDIRFRQVLDNLIANALRFAPPGSAVRVRGRATGRAVVIEVTDAGPGFPLDFIPRAAERFSRADDSRNRRDGGAGLGLAIVKTLVDAHHGDFEVGNGAPAGAWVRITLPPPEPLSSPSNPGPEGWN